MEIIMKDYNLDSFQDKDVYTWDEILEKIEDLEYEVRELKDKIEEREQDIESNYRRLSIAEQVEISDKDFI